MWKISDRRVLRRRIVKSPRSNAPAKSRHSRLITFNSQYWYWTRSIVQSDILGCWRGLFTTCVFSKRALNNFQWHSRDLLINLLFVRQNYVFIHLFHSLNNKCSFETNSMMLPRHVLIIVSTMLCGKKTVFNRDKIFLYIKKQGYYNLFRFFVLNWICSDANITFNCVNTNSINLRTKIFYKDYNIFAYVWEYIVLIKDSNIFSVHSKHKAAVVLHAYNRSLHKNDAISIILSSRFLMCNICKFVIFS